MLILTRKADQAIVIGEDIVIHVLESRGGQTRIGITAPSEVPVHRLEIYKRIHGKPPAVLKNIQIEQEVSE